MVIVSVDSSELLSTHRLTNSAICTPFTFTQINHPCRNYKSIYMSFVCWKSHENLCVYPLVMTTPVTTTTPLVRGERNVLHCSVCNWCWL